MFLAETCGAGDIVGAWRASTFSGGPRSSGGGDDVDPLIFGSAFILSIADEKEKLSI